MDRKSNGQAIDSNQANDTIETKSLGCAQVLNGSYTVGNTSADFASLTDAFTILNTCGVSGPVVLNMLRTYSGLTINKSFVGCSQTNTLTITSSTGRASDVVFQSTTNALALGIQAILFSKILLLMQLPEHELFNLIMLAKISKSILVLLKQIL